jgi:hypothetical protein
MFSSLLWVAVTVLASVGAIFVILRSWDRYVANPTVVSLEKNYRQWSTLFPAVTICYLQNLNYTSAKQEIQKYDTVTYKPTARQRTLLCLQH